MSEIDVWTSPEQNESAMKLATTICKTEFVPDALRNHPDKVMAAMLTGREMGIGPMQSLAKINVIKGRPALSSELMRALVLAKGHDFWVEESTSTRVTVCGQRAGSSHVSNVTWTLDDAKKAGLSGKEIWAKYPRAMLLARATGELCRAMFPDVLAGISYTVEEVEDGFDDSVAIDAEIVEEEKTQVRKAVGATAKSSAPRKTTASKEPKARPPAPPLPGVKAGDDAPHPTRTTAQKIAMRAEQFNLDRGDFADAASGHTTRKCSELSEEQALEAYANVLAVGEGRAEIIETEDGPQVVFKDADAVAMIAETFDVPDENITDAEIVEETETDVQTLDTVDGWRQFLKERNVKMAEVLRDSGKVSLKELAESPIEDRKTAARFVIELSSSR